MRGSGIILDSEGQWTRALASNNIRAIIRWLRILTAEGDVDVEESLGAFSCWVQRTSEFAKKELLTLCFSRCCGLWMFLDQSCFTRVHLLLQRLSNLLTLAQWGRRELNQAHLWHGVGIPCVLCKGMNGSPEVGRGCWDRERRAVKQHIWLGQLVQWWGITGLLPKCPEAQEMKRISQMWREMNNSHRKACLETPGWKEGGVERWTSLIQGMVAWADKQYGTIWTTGDCIDQRYPPPDLQALLKLVLVPHIDNLCVQAIIMYFILDVANFLQCKDDLLQSFCHAFTIPPSFSQLIQAFWMLDHGHVTGSMELLLSPKAAAPWLSWQHRCIIHSLLTRKQPRMALRYLHWTRPATESCQDIKLCADVLLQNSCVSDAWALLRKGHTESDDMAKYFLQGCKELGLCAEASKCIRAGYNDEDDVEDDDGIESSLQPEGTAEKQQSVKVQGSQPCPLSAQLYQSQNTHIVSSEDLVKLLREAVAELRKPHPKISEVVWPEQLERRNSSRELCLSTQALRHLVLVPVDTADGTAEPEDEQPLISGVCCLKQPETLVPLSFQSVSMEGSTSMSSFTSASSRPPLRQDRPYFHESTLTLQRISALLSDRENEISEEQESRPPSAVDTTPDCLDPTLTLDGATYPVSFNSLNKDSREELVISAEWGGVEEIKTSAAPGEYVFTVDEVAGPSTDEDLPLHRRPRGRLNFPPQFYSDEDNQSVPFLLEPQVERPNFLSPDYVTAEKLDYYKGVPEETIHGPLNVTDLCSTAPSENQQARSACVSPQIFNFDEATASQLYLDLEPLQRASHTPNQDEMAECFHWDSQDAVDQPEILTPCALSETTRDQLSEPHRSLLPADSATGAGAGSEAVRGSAEERRSSSPVIPTHRSICPPQFQIPGGPLSPLTGTGNSQLSPAPSDTGRERSSEASPEKEAACSRSSSDRLGHCKPGSCGKQALECSRASTGQVSAITEKSVVNFMESSTKQRERKDSEQAEKEEPAGRKGSEAAQHRQGGAEQGVTGQRGKQTRKGKRVKKA